MRARLQASDLDDTPADSAGNTAGGRGGKTGGAGSNGSTEGPRRPVLRNALIGLGLLAWVAGTTSAITVGVIAHQRSGDHPRPPAAAACSHEPALSIAAAPEIAPVVTAVVAAGPGRQATAAGCPSPRVTAEPASQVLDAIRAERGDRPDVWIPDSSLWTGQPMPPGRGVPQGSPSVARSPMVLAVPRAVAPPQLRAGGTAADLVPAAAGLAVPIRWAMPDPQQSPAAVAAILTLQQATAGRSNGPSILADVLRTSQVDLPQDSGAQLDAAVSGHLAVPSSEQAVHAYDADHPAQAGLVSTPLGNPGYSFDYPYVVLAAEHDRRAQADQLLADLRGDLGRRLLAAAGFRDYQGLVGFARRLSPDRDHGSVPASDDVASAARTLSAVRRGSRVLAVVDVSGSMSTPVPGHAGATRLDLALRAAVDGLALYPDGTEAGLWTFSTDLTRTTDYAVQVPIVPLGPGADGVSGRMRLGQALVSVRVKPNGDTGLYDTALAAVREMRRGWDPTRQNSVVLITDGANDDSDGITLAQLLATLRKESDPARPVALYAIAYGPASDVASLSAITAATGGHTYVARDPGTIGAVLMDAIGRRACSGTC